jgi:hypothetical protein
MSSFAPPPDPCDDVKDAFLEAELDRAIEPYLPLLSPEAVEAMRESLRDVLLNHPAAATLVRRARPLPLADASGDFPVGLGELGTEAASLPAVGGSSRKGR